MMLTDFRLRHLCIENQWFTCGTVRQYEKLFEMNDAGRSVEELALVIWICSTGYSEMQILRMLKEAAEK